MSIEKNHFDRSKPFYPLIMHFIVQLIGFRDLAIKGLPNVESITSFEFDATDAQERDEIQGEIDKLCGPLQLHTVQDGTHIYIDVNEIATDIQNNFVYLSNFVMLAAGSVLILAHEHCKNQSYHNTDPIWEFLRHCRNAAGHGGKFNFLNEEPRRPAIWGKLEILRAAQGKALFKNSNDDGFISPGDVIKLLWDLEQQYSM